MVCQTHFDGWRDAINRRLYRKFIRQLFLDRLLVLVLQGLRCNTIAALISLFKLTRVVGIPAVQQAFNPQK